MTWKGEIAVIVICIRFRRVRREKQRLLCNSWNKLLAELAHWKKRERTNLNTPNFARFLWTGTLSHFHLTLSSRPVASHRIPKCFHRHLFPLFLVINLFLLVHFHVFKRHCKVTSFQTVTVLKDRVIEFHIWSVQLFKPKIPVNGSYYSQSSLKIWHQMGQLVTEQSQISFISHWVVYTAVS